MKPRAFLVAVNYNDLLEITLPYNRHHFESVHVITAIGRNDVEREVNARTVEIATKNECRATCTDAFYRDGAKFNKWAALEEELSMRGRHDWLALMDADILIPKVINFWGYLRPGYLYTPRRYMMEVLPKSASDLPPEEEWVKYPLHPQDREFAGYLQVFHGNDSVLGLPPWHEVNWLHAGGADSFFQKKWSETHKVRPPFRVLHLGPAGVNWAGRVSPYLDGTRPEGADKTLGELRELLWQRKPNRHSADPFSAEKIHKKT